MLRPQICVILIKAKRKTELNCIFKLQLGAIDYYAKNEILIIRLKKQYI